MRDRRCERQTQGRGYKQVQSFQLVNTSASPVQLQSVDTTVPQVIDLSAYPSCKLNLAALVKTNLVGCQQNGTRVSLCSLAPMSTKKPFLHSLGMARKEPSIWMAFPRPVFKSSGPVPTVTQLAQALVVDAKSSRLHGRHSRRGSEGILLGQCRH
jgi:hypothetical protein